MPRLTIYIPTELHNKIKNKKINVSAICQKALQKTVINHTKYNDIIQLKKQIHLMVDNLIEMK